ncbi:acetyltransferase [Burkholderia pseudomallei]|nr:acetyltransferase [Burkholderia pseudomallei]
MEFRPIKESDLGSTYDIRFPVTENRILPHQIHLLERDRVLEQLRSGFGVLAIEGDAAVGYCTAAGLGGPGKRSWRTAPKHCHAGPRRLRERPPSRRPHRWRHVRARAPASHARRQAPNAVRYPKHRARAHAPAGARPSADSRLSPRIGKPAVVTSASRWRAVCRQRRPPSADGFAARTCAAFFRRRNRQRASALPPPARRVIARDPPRPRSTPDNTPAADPGTRPSRAADTRAHRDRIRPSRSPRRADRIRRSSRRPRPR